jgi:hypothetical protein
LAVAVQVPQLVLHPAPTQQQQVVVTRYLAPLLQQVVVALVHIMALIMPTLLVKTVVPAAALD